MSLLVPEVAAVSDVAQPTTVSFVATERTGVVIDAVIVDRPVNVNGTVQPVVQPPEFLNRIWMFFCVSTWPHDVVDSAPVSLSDAAEPRSTALLEAASVVAKVESSDLRGVFEALARWSQT